MLTYLTLLGFTSDDWIRVWIRSTYCDWLIHLLNLLFLQVLHPSLSFPVVGESRLFVLTIVYSLNLVAVPRGAFTGSSVLSPVDRQLDIEAWLGSVLTSLTLSKMDYFYPKKAQNVLLPLFVSWAATDGYHLAWLTQQGLQKNRTLLSLLHPLAEILPWKRPPQSVVG